MFMAYIKEIVILPQMIDCLAIGFHLSPFPIARQSIIYTL